MLLPFLIAARLRRRVSTAIRACSDVYPDIASRRVSTAIRACSDVYPDIASRFAPPYPATVHWGSWVCAIESRSDSGWNFDCQDNRTWTCTFSITPDSGGGYDCDGTCTNSQIVHHAVIGSTVIFFLIAAIVALICFIRYRCRNAAVAQVDELDGQSVVVVQNTGGWLQPQSRVVVFDPELEDGPSTYGMPPSFTHPKDGGAEPESESSPPTVEVLYLGPG
jgi:hypothetical protein